MNIRVHTEEDQPAAIQVEDDEQVAYYDEQTGLYYDCDGFYIDMTDPAYLEEGDLGIYTDQQSQITTAQDD